MQPLSPRGFCAGDLQLWLDYEGPGRHICSVRAGAPSRDVRALLSLCRLVLAKTPSEQPVTQVAVHVTPAAARPRQLSFFEPTASAPDKLAVTVARSAPLCGPESVSAPVPADPCADDAFLVAPLDGGATSSPERPEAPPVALKRLRPPRPVELIWRRGVPIRREGTDLGGRVVSWRGPFRRSAGWWNDECDPDAVHGDCDVDDLQLSSGVAYRVAFDRCCSRWLAQGWYDGATRISVVN